jgi:exo-beta-1,3-glucanase (GH17 family)
VPGCSVRRWVVILAFVCVADCAVALPTIETGIIRDAPAGVRVTVTGTVNALEWGDSALVRVVVGDRQETIARTTFHAGKGSRLRYDGEGLVRRLTLDLPRGRFTLRAAGVSRAAYVEPLWIVLDPGVPYAFALPVVAEAHRTRLGGKAIHRLDGVAFAPWGDGQDPTTGAVATEAQIERRLGHVARYAEMVRTFGSTHGLERVPALARRRGLAVAAGAWLSSDPVANRAEVDALVANARAGDVALAIVGVEVLLRGDLNESDLLGWIQEVRDALSGTTVRVTTADTWAVLLAHPSIIAACDVVAANVYPYWEGLGIDAAAAALDDHYRSLVQAAGGKEVLIAETGWPSAGNAVGGAEPAPENAALYCADVQTWARAEAVRVFYFEAFDEAWKGRVEGPQGAHWGIADSSGALKPGMRAALAGRTVAKTWERRRSCPPHAPSDERCERPTRGIVGVRPGMSPASPRAPVQSMLGA